MNKLFLVILMLTSWSGTLAGCAATDQRSALHNSTISRGVVYLMMSGNNWNPPGEPASSIRTQRSSRSKPLPDNEIAVPPKMTIVRVTNGAGKLAGKSVVQVDVGDLMVTNLRKRLTAEGYAVVSVRKIPEKAENGIDISWVSTDLMQSSGLLTLSGECDLRIRLEQWKNGAKLTSHNYSTVVTDYSITKQNQLLAKLIGTATDTISGQAVPDILKDISTLRK
jgi:hypothetical protein